MIHLHLTDNEWDLYLDTLADSHIVDVDVTLYDQDEDAIDSLSRPINKVTAGSVTMDSTADISRSLDLTLLDPNNKLRFEGNSPARGAVFADRYLGVNYNVWVPAMDDFVVCPVFRGPVTSFTRNGVEVEIECQGKEMLLLDPHFATQGYTIKRRTRLDDAIKMVAKQKGETKFRLPDLPQRLHNDHIVDPQAQPWLIIAGGSHVDGLKSIHYKRDPKKDKKQKEVTQNAPSLITLAPGNRRLLYDGRGNLTTRRKMHKPHFVFTDGNQAEEQGVGPFVLSRPNVTYDPTEFKNHVVVHGGKGKGHGRLVVAASLHPSNPLSPVGLARNGDLTFLTEFIEADNLKTWKDCKEKAQEELAHISHMGVQLEFDALPIPFLEEGDIVTVAVDDWEIDFPLTQFTIPLTSGDSMSLGYTRKTSKFAHRGHRTRQKHHHRHHHHHPSPTY